MEIAVYRQMSVALVSGTRAATARPPPNGDARPEPLRAAVVPSVPATARGTAHQVFAAAVPRSPRITVAPRPVLSVRVGSVRAVAAVDLTRLIVASMRQSPTAAAPRCAAGRRTVSVTQRAAARAVAVGVAVCRTLASSASERSCSPPVAEPLSPVRAKTVGSVRPPNRCSRRTFTRRTFAVDRLAVGTAA